MKLASLSSTTEAAPAGQKAPGHLGLGDRRRKSQHPPQWGGQAWPAHPWSVALDCLFTTRQGRVSCGRTLQGGSGLGVGSAGTLLSPFSGATSLFPNLKLPQPSSLSPSAPRVGVSEGQLCLTGSEGMGRRPGLHMHLSALPGGLSARVAALVDGDVPSGLVCLLVHAGAVGRTPHTVLSPELESQTGCGEGRICLLKVNNG